MQAESVTSLCGSFLIVAETIFTNAPRIITKLSLIKVVRTNYTVEIGFLFRLSDCCICSSASATLTCFSRTVREAYYCRRRNLFAPRNLMKSDHPVNHKVWKLDIYHQTGMPELTDRGCFGTVGRQPRKSNR